MSQPRQTKTGAELARRAAETVESLVGEPLAAGLYVVATPIGNLGDISIRALSVLARAGLIACEDTRHTRKLLSHYGIRARLSAYHEHNAARERPKLLARIQAGTAVALVSDAGTPLISDPGNKIVREALDTGLLVTSIPGPSAALAALTSAGLATDRFYFEGFLPPKESARRKRLEALATVPATLVVYEAPGRLEATLRDMGEVLGNRGAAVAKELTKLHERVERGPLDGLAARFPDDASLKGEFVILVSAPAKSAVSDEAIRAHLAEAMETLSFRDAVRQVTETLALKRGRVYAIALDLTGRSR